MTYSFTGTVTVNSSGIITAADITLNDGTLSDPVFNRINSAGGPSGSPLTNYAYVAGSDGQIALYYLTTLDGTGDIDLCIATRSNCNSGTPSYSSIYVASAFGNNPVDLNSGTIDPGSTSVTPEPASLLLLGTGIAGLAAMGRRRFVKI